VDNMTRLIADYAASLSFEELPPAVVHAATQYVVDSLGCAGASYECAPAAAVPHRRLHSLLPSRLPALR